MAREPKEPRVRVRSRFRAIVVEIEGAGDTVVQQLAAAMLAALQRPDEVTIEQLPPEPPPLPKRRRR